jgi:hypothetical protein
VKAFIDQQMGAEAVTLRKAFFQHVQENIKFHLGIKQANLIFAPLTAETVSKDAR